MLNNLFQRTPDNAAQRLIHHRVILERFFRGPRTLVCQSAHLNLSGTLLLPGAPAYLILNPQDLIEDTRLLTQRGVLPHSCRLQHYNGRDRRNHAGRKFCLYHTHDPVSPQERSENRRLLVEAPYRPRPQCLFHRPFIAIVIARQPQYRHAALEKRRVGAVSLISVLRDIGIPCSLQPQSPGVCCAM